MHNMLYSIIMMTFEIIGQNRLAASNKAGGIRTREGAGHSLKKQEKKTVF